MRALAIAEEASVSLLRALVSPFVLINLDGDVVDSFTLTSSVIWHLVIP